MKKIVVITCLFFSLPSLAFSPVAPTKNVDSQVKSGEKIDLPYQVPQPENVENSDSEDQTDTSTGETVDGGDSAQPAFNWETLPFMPSKAPDLKPAADPEIT